MKLQELKKYIDLEKFILQNGWTRNKEKSTRRHPVYTNGTIHVVIIEGNDCKMYYCLGDDKNKGSIIDFVAKNVDVVNGNLHSVEKFLQKYLSGNRAVLPVPTTSKVYKQEFSAKDFYIPKQKNIDNYIYSAIKKKNINNDTLNSKVFNNFGEIKRLFKDKEIINIAFPLFNNNGEIRAIDYRYLTKVDGISKEKKLFVNGSEKELAIGLSSSIEDNIKVLFLCESPIDAMAHYQLHCKNREDIQYIFFDGTISRGQIKTFLTYLTKLRQKGESIKVVAGFDKDSTAKMHGQGYNISIMLSSLMGEVVQVANTPEQLSIYADSEDSYHSICELFTCVEHTCDSKLKAIIFKKSEKLPNQIYSCLISENIKVHIPKNNDWSEDLQKKC